MSYQPIIFPELKNKKWAIVNLADIAEKETFSDKEVNPLLNPEFCDNWVKSIAKKHNVDFTWGGHFENRKELWKGYYRDASEVIHLGIDYNVPAGTLISAPVNCEVVHSWTDNSIENGWGGRLLLKMEQSWKGAQYLLFGHLAHENLPTIGTKYKAGENITRTGIPNENGGWFPHLHVQCVTQEFLDIHTNDLTQLDGYFLIKGEPYEFAPDPTLLVGMEY